MSDDYLKDLSSTCLENEKVKSMGKKKKQTLAWNEQQ